MTLEVTRRERMAWGFAEISQATGLSINFLRSEERNGNLPTVKFGRRVLVLDEELRKYLETGSEGAKKKQ